MITQETIYDYNPTPKECGRFGGLSNKGVMLRYYKACNDGRLYHLGLLFSMRGDKERAESYWEQMEDKEPLKTLVCDFP